MIRERDGTDAPVEKRRLRVEPKKETDDERGKAQGRPVDDGRARRMWWGGGVGG